MILKNFKKKSSHLELLWGRKTSYNLWWTSVISLFNVCLNMWPVFLPSTNLKLDDFFLKFSKIMLYPFFVFLLLLVCSSFHVTVFYLFEFWISKNDNFKRHFGTLIDFSWKKHEHRSCRTYQDLQLLFWSFLHPIK